MSFNKILLSFFLLAFTLTGASPGLGQSFRLEVVAAPGKVIGDKTITGTGTFLSVNDARDVAFMAEFERPDGSRSFGLFLNDELVVETNTVLHGETLGLFGNPILNNRGDMLFSVVFPNRDRGIMTRDRLIAKTGDSIGGRVIQGFISGPRINDLGQVLLHVRFEDGGNALVADGAILVESGVPLPGRTPTNIVSGVDWNNHGDVLFEDVIPFPNLSRAAMTQEGLITQTGATFAGQLVFNLFHLSLNNNREVVFNGGVGLLGYDLDTGEERFLVPEGSLVDGDLIHLPSNPELNDNGQLAYFAILNNTDRAVVAGDEIVVRAGDTLDGRVFGSAGGAGLSQNNKGDIGITVVHTDFTWGLVLATRDTDGDGIPDDDDSCPSSDLGDTVSIEGCETGIDNELFADGCSLADVVNGIVDACFEGAKNHGQAVSCVSHATNELKDSGLLGGGDKGAIQSCLP